MLYSRIFHVGRVAALKRQAMGLSDSSKNVQKMKNAPFSLSLYVLVGKWGNFFEKSLEKLEKKYFALKFSLRVP